MEHDKLGFYLGIARTIQKLKDVRANTQIDAEGEDTLMDMLWRIQRLLGDSTNDQGLAGLRPFPRLRLFQKDFFEFYQALNESLGEDSNPLQDVPLGREQHRKLKDLVGAFEQVFREEVETRVVFISPDRLSLHEFSAPNEFLHSEADRQYFQFLPRIAQQGFRDAGRCLVYSLPGAAISMSLQAVEATIRFFYVRHGGPNDRREWGPMINWLRDQQPSLLPGDAVGQRHCHAMLDRLRDRYRNAILHGRAYGEAGRSAASSSEAETVFRDCWAAARLLAAETTRRRQLKCRVRISDDLDFDTAVASFLYTWNPELPPFGIEESVKFDSSMAPKELIDDTVEDTNFWPNHIQATANESLSRRVRACFRMQPNYAATIDPLIDFLDRCQQGIFSSRFNPQHSREDDVSLLDLYAGIEPHLKRVRTEEGDAQPRIEPQHILVETWKMLDTFVESSFSPEGPSLVTELDMQPVFKTLCTDGLSTKAESGIT